MRGLYTYELRVVDIHGQECTLGKTSVDVTDIFPQDFTLEQNYPNPFNLSTTIHYTIPSTEQRAKSAGMGGGSKLSALRTKLKIYNILGQEVRTLVDSYQNPGYYTIGWDGRDERGNEVPCGVYLYRLSVDNGHWSETKRMLLLK